MEVKNKEVVKEKIKPENTLGLRWTWYLFLAANILVIIGIAITWGITNRPDVDAGKAYIAIIVCNTVAIILVVLFYYFDSKDIFLVRQHVPAKYFRMYFSGGIIFALCLVATCIYTAFAGQIYNSLSELKEPSIQWNITYGILFGIAALFTLTAIAIYRYGKYKIDITMAKRRHGEQTQTDGLTDKPDGVKVVTEIIDNTPATSGLVDNANQEQKN